MNTPHIFLVGNGTYTNRGCEAIVRGTTRILDAAFGNQTTYVTASFGSEAEIMTQASQEKFSRLRHERLVKISRKSVDFLKFRLCKRLGIKRNICLFHLPADASHCWAALQVGGDNYSLDYGYPWNLIGIDCWLEQHGVPLVLWGASVGPFDSDPEFEREMTTHLSKFSLITVREARSFRYLQNLGLMNIAQVADPAFLMEPEAVPGIVLPPSFIGLNLSPLTAARVADGSLEKWCAICAVAILRLLEECDLPVVLIPHVAWPDPANDDHPFLKSVAGVVNRPDRVTVLGMEYTAAQLKWVIGKATVFAGARTHSTIAALSMGVPTLSLAYSVKAWGINEDVFGHAEYCMDVGDLLSEHALTGRILSLLNQKDTIRRQLNLRLPDIQADAMKAGVMLREILGR